MHVILVIETGVKVIQKQNSLIMMHNTVKQVSLEQCFYVSFRGGDLQIYYNSLYLQICCFVAVTGSM